MYKIIIVPLLFLILLSCKEQKSEQIQDFSSEVKEKLNLDVSKLTSQIKAFYVQRHLTQGVEYHIKDISILQIDPVSSFYVDSLKIDLYQSGFERIEDNLRVRNNMIENMASKARLHEKQGNTEKMEAIQNNIENYKKRNLLQQEEYEVLKNRDSLVRIRMKEAESAAIQYFQVDFVIRDQVEHQNRTDTSSLIFNKYHQIEDLLKDRPWDGSF